MGANGCQWVLVPRRALGLRIEWWRLCFSPTGSAQHAKHGRPECGAGAIPEYQGSSCGLVTRVPGRRPAGCKSGHPLSLPLPAKTNVINLKQAHGRRWHNMVAFSNGRQGHLLIPWIEGVLWPWRRLSHQPDLHRPFGDYHVAVENLRWNHPLSMTWYTVEPPSIPNKRMDFQG